MNRSYVAALCGWGLLFFGQVEATPVKSVRVTTYAEFAEGQVHGVLLSSQGEARVGLAARRLGLPSLEEDSVRAIAAGSSGSLYLGTGGEAPWVLRYVQGQLVRLGKLDAGTWVTALCPFEPSGGAAEQVLAATAQDGRIFRLGKDGRAEVVAELAAERIWALLRDGKRGVTYAAAGPSALWAIADADLLPRPPGAAQGAKPKTVARKLFETDSRQFLSLDRGDDGALYVGTADDAVLYRVDPSGARATVQAVHDFAGNEVRAIAHYKDVLYVAVNDMQRGDTQSRGTKMVTPPAGSAPGVKPTPPAGSTAPANPSPVEKKGKGALYRIDPSGRVEQLHAIVDGFFNALAVDAAGNVLAAASTPGGRGRLYLVTPDRTVSTALEVKESDILTLFIGGGKERYLGTGNSGAFYVLSDKPLEGAHYLSRVFYAQAPSHFGNLRFSGEGNLRVETRSGNLAKPDSSWSSWQPLQGGMRQPSTDEQVGKIASPDGRYLQVRVFFGEKAVLRDYTLYYQPLNQRPRVTDILIGEDPTGRVARGVRPTSPLRPRSPVVKLRFKAENPDEDELNYRVFVRMVGAPPSGADAGWLRLSGSEPLLRPELDWNTETVADGLYELKVIVSDERSNPPELSLSHELLSPPFLVDNKRPELRELAYQAQTATLSGRVVDATSPIAELSYAIDNGDFYPIGVRDGVLDDLSEDFQIKPLRLSPGPHTLLLRASDVADNTTTAQIIVYGPPATSK